MIRTIFKVLAASSLTLAIVWTGYVMIAKDQVIVLDQMVAKENVLKQNLEDKYSVANNLDTFKAQLTEMEAVFGTILELLPGKYSDPDIYAKLVSLAKENDVTIHEYKHLSRQNKDFYAEDLVRTKVTGTYKNVINYLYEVQSHGQVMSLSDYTLRAYKPEEVLFEGNIDVYTYLDQDERTVRKIRKRKI